MMLNSPANILKIQTQIDEVVCWNMRIYKAINQEIIDQLTALNKGPS
jgi:hypothetical protein